jgi:quercetin dioxygenase-like cupin family protein
MNKLYFDGSKDPVHLRLVRYAPGYTEPAHSHGSSEVIYLVSGDLRIGDQQYVAGDALYLEAHTVYGPLSAGESGTEFVLFRTAPGDYIPQQ